VTTEPDIGDEDIFFHVKGAGNEVWFSLTPSSLFLISSATPISPFSAPPPPPSPVGSVFIAFIAMLTILVDCSVRSAYYFMHSYTTGGPAAAAAAAAFPGIVCLEEPERRSLPAPQRAAELEEGQRVCFKLGAGRDGRPIALHVSPLDCSPAEQVRPPPFL
jgi:cold shock CspA family protein